MQINRRHLSAAGRAGSGGGGATSTTFNVSDVATVWHSGEKVVKAVYSGLINTEPVCINEWCSKSCYRHRISQPFCFIDAAFRINCAARWLCGFSVYVAIISRARGQKDSNCYEAYYSYSQQKCLQCSHHQLNTMQNVVYCWNVFIFISWFSSLRAYTL